MMNLRHVLLWLLGLIAVAGIIIYVGWEQVSSVVFQVNLLTFFILCLLQVTGLFLLGYQWHFLLQKAGARISLAAVIRVYLTGSFFESVTPSVKLGGEAVKLYLFRQETDLSAAKIGGLLLLQKFIVLMPLVVICATLYIFSSHLRVVFDFTNLLTAHILLPLLGTIALVYFFIKLFYARKKELNGRLSRLMEATEVRMESAKKFLKEGFNTFRGLLTMREKVLLLVISSSIWLLYPFKVYVITQVLGLEANFLLLTVAVFTAYFVGLLPLLPGGLGSFEAALALMLSRFGFSAAEALSVTLLTRAVTFWFPLVLSALASTLTGMKLYRVKNSSTYSFDSAVDWRRYNESS